MSIYPCFVLGVGFTILCGALVFLVHGAFKTWGEDILYKARWEAREYVEKKLELHMRDMKHSERKPS